MNLYFSKYNNLQIKVDCDDSDVLRHIESFLTDFKSGYRFMPKYRAGVWDGRISIFNKPTRTFPYGVLLDVIMDIKKEYPDVKISMESDVKDMFGGDINPTFKYDLIYQPYDYQRETIEALVKMKKGIAVVATAGGKSLIITYIIKNIPKDVKSLIIVPTLQLVDQFKDDMIEYGIDDGIIGQVNSSIKEFDRDIVISTWQSLKNRPLLLPEFDVVMVDEVHTAQANTISTILQGCENAEYRFGVTGTMPTNRLDSLTVKSYLGPVLRQFTGKDLADRGYVSSCVVKQLWINYKTNYGRDYQFIRDNVFINPFRMNVIRSLVAKSNNSVLILIDRIEKEGIILEEYMRDCFPDRDVVFLSGKDKSNIRDMWRKDMNIKNDIICIATFPIFQQGVNIPSLREIILASSTKSFVRVIQSLGRVLRKHVSKENGGAVLWDICDNVKHLKDHANKRHRHYTKEKHVIKELEITE